MVVHHRAISQISLIGSFEITANVSDSCFVEVQPCHAWACDWILIVGITLDFDTRHFKLCQVKCKTGANYKPPQGIFPCFYLRFFLGLLDCLTESCTIPLRVSLPWHISLHDWILGKSSVTVRLIVLIWESMGTRQKFRHYTYKSPWLNTPQQFRHGASNNSNLRKYGHTD